MTTAEMRRLVNMVADEVVRRLKDGTAEDEWLTTAQAAQLLGIAAQTVRNKASMLPNNGKTGKERRYSKKGLKQLMQRL